MRIWMVILLILSCIDFTIKFSNGHKIGISFFIRLATLIVFLTNY